MYAAGSPFAAYCHQCWWSDAWDPLSFGRDIDLNRSFFEQFKELSLRVPRQAVLNPINENSDYCNFADWNKNGYMLINSNSNEDSFYSTLLLDSRTSMDCFWTKDSELCYECVNVEKSYNVRHSLDCADCRDSQFLTDCRGCSQCIGCANLRQKSLHVFNKPVTKQAYDALTDSLRSASGTAKFRKDYDAFLVAQPRLALHTPHTEESSGEHLVRCKNTRESFDVFDMQDCAYCDTDMILKDSWDCHCAVKAELCVENTSLIGYHTGFTAFCRNPKETWYSWDCHDVRDVFGCVGLRRNEYCVLNKHYTKEEYGRLVSKLIQRMRNDGEWGEFFPVALSPFAYNDTIAQEYAPMTKEQVLHRGWQWREQKDELPKVSKVIPAAQLPDTIDDVSDDILQWAVQCEATKRPYKVIKQELEFYRRNDLPVPRLHPEERHRRRVALRNPRKLWKRKCATCATTIETTYAPTRPETVVCEKCYLREVY
jgi:hypothetical protein